MTQITVKGFWHWHNPFTKIGRCRLAYRWRTHWRWRVRRPWCWIFGHEAYESCGWSGGYEGCLRCRKRLRELYVSETTNVVDGVRVVTRPGWVNPEWKPKQRE